MKNIEEAKQLANLMTKIGELAGKETKCIITDMNEPVGYAVGNTLEIIEAIDILKGKAMPKDVENIITELGANMLLLAKKVTSIEEGKNKILENIKNRKGYEKLIELVENQGGDITYIENTNKFEKAKYIIPIIAEKDGVIKKLDAYYIGKMSVYLGAGRMKKEDEIDKAVGFVFNKKCGDEVKKGEVIGNIHSNDRQKAEEISNNKWKFITIKD